MRDIIVLESFKGGDVVYEVVDNIPTWNHPLLGVVATEKTWIFESTGPDKYRVKPGEPYTTDPHVIFPTECGYPWDDAVIEVLTQLGVTSSNEEPKVIDTYGYGMRLEAEFASGARVILDHTTWSKRIFGEATLSEWLSAMKAFQNWREHRK